MLIWSCAVKLLIFCLDQSFMTFLLENKRDLKGFHHISGIIPGVTYVLVEQWIWPKCSVCQYYARNKVQSSLKIK